MTIKGYTVNDYRASTEAKKEADEKLIIDIMDEPETTEQRVQRAMEYMTKARNRLTSSHRQQIIINAATYENLKLELMGK